MPRSEEHFTLNIKFFQHVIWKNRSKTTIPKVEEVIDHQAGEIVWLVGQDVQAQSAAGQSVEEFGDPLVWLGLVRPAALVLVTHAGGATLDHGLVPVGLWQDATGQDLQAIADKIAVGIAGVSGEAEAGQDGIHRLGQISQGVKQGAIQIKEDRPDVRNRAHYQAQ